MTPQDYYQAACDNLDVIITQAESHEMAHTLALGAIASALTGLLGLEIEKRAVVQTELQTHGY